MASIQGDGHGTDWDRVFREKDPRLTEVHRGLRIWPDYDAYQHAHDKSVPVAERAHALLGHIGDLMRREHRGIGMSWSDSPTLARQAAGEGGWSHHGLTGRPDPESPDYDDRPFHMPVVLNAAWPEKEHIETRPHVLDRHGVFPYDDAEMSQGEVPVRNGAPVRVTGISWAKDGTERDTWNHHVFDHPVHYNGTEFEPHGPGHEHTAALLEHFEAAEGDGRRYYHASDEDFEPGDTVSGGHRLDDLYLADTIPGAHKYYTSGNVYEIEPHDDPQPSMKGEYTVPSGTVKRRVPSEEVSKAVRDAYNAPDQKAARDRTNRRQREHSWRVKNDRWYHGYGGQDKPGWDEYQSHWFPEGIENATDEQSEASRHGSPLPPEIHRWIHGTEAAVQPIDLYHHTTPENAAAIMRERKMKSAERGPDGRLSAFFTTDPSPLESQAGRRGSATVHVRVPEHLTWVEDEFPSGEQWHGIPLAELRPEHFVDSEISREASVQHHGISGESAPESADIFAEPTGISPVGSHHADLMRHPERSVRVNGRGESEWVHPHLTAPDHGPYYVARDPGDPDGNEGTLHVLDRNGHATHRPYKGGSWQHANAYRDWHRLTYRQDPEGEGTERDVPSIMEDHQRHLSANPPQFPHSRTDPRDTEILRRPDARVARPEGYSPSDEYHGSYEVVRHPDTGRFHVVDNQGRHAGAGYDGAPTQIGAERSRDYIEKRQMGKERARGIADKLMGGGMEALDPGGTAESRESEANMAAASDMMGRYEGGRGKVKFDSDEEGGRPYYEREHHLPNGQASGWYAKHYGGPSADVYHRATGDLSYALLRFPVHPEDEGSMTPRLHPAFRDEHLAESLKNWHDNEESQERQSLEAADPRISRWKQQRLGSQHEVVAHFEETAAAQDPDERPFGYYTLRHRTEDLGERKPRHFIEAHTPEGSVVGRMNWFGTTGWVHHIDVAGEEDDVGNGLSSIGDGRDHQGRGLATAMWDWSQEMRPKAKHSKDQSNQGKAWARGLKDRERRDPPEEPPSFQVTAAAEYGPKPEFRAAPEHLSDDEKMEHWEGERRKKHAWESHIRRGLALGHLDYGCARELGYWGNGDEHPDETWNHEGEIVSRRGWQPLPQRLYHVTTNLPAVREHGLKSRRELGQHTTGGLGLGGGPDDTVSLTSHHGTARNILRSMHEYHDVLNGRKTPQEMIDEARTGSSAERPFLHDWIGLSGHPVPEEDELPRPMRAVMEGHEVYTNPTLRTREDMHEQEGPGWEPEDEGRDFAGHHVHNGPWRRTPTPERRRQQLSEFYKNFSWARSWAKGPDNPLFSANDAEGFAHLDPRHFAIVHATPHPGAQGFPQSSLQEWRTASGDAVHVHRAEQLEGGHLKEASVSLASRFQPGLRNPHTGGDEWFHGTQSDPGDFVHGFSHDDTHDHEDEELREHLSHWNTKLGSHFAADHGVAEHFARQGASTDDDEDDWGGDDGRSRYQEKDPQSVIHARLHLRNPKVYDSEFDMDHEAYEHEYGQRKNYISKHFEDSYEDEDPSHEDYDPDTPGEGEEWPLAARYRHDDKQPIPREQMQRRTLFSNPDMPEMPERTRWLASHPDKAGIARRFKERLQAQGHDGILYGNEFETSHATGDGGHHDLSAIIFHPHQAEITQHHQTGAPCLSREEGESQRGRMPQPGQEELPGVEEHADHFPNGFLRGAALLAHFGEPRTAMPLHMQQKLFHMQPDPTLHEPESGRHNPSDPEAHLRWRHEHDEGYEPDTCEQCGEDQRRWREHAEKHDDWQRGQDWYTDWSEEHPGDAIHRGIGVALPPEVHAVVHDESRPLAERARALAHHVVSRGGLGNFWSSDPDVSKTYAESSAKRYSSQGEKTPVMLHAHTPGTEHIETDPETLQHWGVYSYHLAGNREVPLQHQAPVHLKGISWAPPGHEAQGPHPSDPKWHNPGPHRFDQDRAWTHHEFGGDGISANASLAAVVAHFDEGPQVPSFTWKYQTYGPEGGYTDKEQEVAGPFYHGSRSKGLRPGSSVKKGMSANPWGDEGNEAAEPDPWDEFSRPSRYMRAPEEHEAFGHLRDDHRINPELLMRLPDETLRRTHYEIHSGELYGAPGSGHYHDERPGEDNWDGALRGLHPEASLPAVVAHFEDGDQYVAPPQPGDETWSHLQEAHGARPSAGSDKAPGADFTSALHRRFHDGKKAFPGSVPHHHGAQAEAPAAGQSARDSISRMFTPIPPEELEAQRRASEPKPERLDDREYSIRDVSRHYDWEGFDPHEIEHLVHRPEHATFTREDVPVHTLRHADEHGNLVAPPSYHDIASQDDDERERLEGLERGYENGEPVPPIVTVRDGEHHIIADGSHRAAVHVRRGSTHIPAFVTQRTIYPGAHEASRREDEIVLAPVCDTVPAIDASPLAQVIAAAGLLGSWAPQTREDALDGISAFTAEVLPALRQGLLRLAAVIEEMPVHPDVAELLYGIARASRVAAQDGAEMLRRLPPEAPWQESGPPNR